MSAHVWALLLCWWHWPLMWTAGERRCTACGRPGHIAANCPDEIWRRK